MDHFTYIDGQLHAEGVPLTRIAEEAGTPTYVYSTATLVHHYRVFADAFAGQNATICYAVKANSNQAVITTLAREGAGADVLSEGELRRALEAGVPGAKIVFSGVGKSRREISLALEAGVGQINVESEPELELISARARAHGTTASIAVRVNPDVDAKTHEKITTGRKENKFGIDLSRAPEIYARAAALPGIEAVGVAIHIGSQLTELAPFGDAFSLVAELVETLRAAGHDIRRLDLGGGLGIPYRDDTPPAPADYAALVRDTTGQGYHRAPRRRAGARARPHDRRQCRDPADPGALREKGHGEKLRGGGRGHERPRAARALRRLARHRSSGGARRGRPHRRRRRGWTGLRDSRYFWT
jgi:diaminopimelate decarboxylase